jgi:hypothetical protein
MSNSQLAIRSWQFAIDVLRAARKELVFGELPSAKCFQE